MASFTSPHNLPLVDPATDYIKDSTQASALAEDLNAISTAANAAIGAEGARAEQAAIDDATAKYGGLPQRMTNVEAKNTAQDVSIQNLRDDVNFNADKNTQQDGRLTSIEDKNTAQDVSIQNLRDDVNFNADKNTQQDGRLTSIEDKNTAQDVSIQNLRDDVTFINGKNVEQDGRLDDLESIQAIKSVRFEVDHWVWDLVNPTHYVLIAHDGKPTVRATQFPQPSPTTPEFIW